MGLHWRVACAEHGYRRATGDGLVTDSPYLEGKEQIGGFWVITSPDLDAALEWGRQAAEATGLPIEMIDAVKLMLVVEGCE